MTANKEAQDEVPGSDILTPIIQHHMNKSWDVAIDDAHNEGGNNAKPRL